MVCSKAAFLSSFFSTQDSLRFSFRIKEENPRDCLSDDALRLHFGSIISDARGLYPNLQSNAEC